MPRSPRGAAVRTRTGTAWPSIWFDSEAAIVELASTEAGQAAAAALYEDEQRFLDLERCELFLSEDHQLVG